MATSGIIYGQRQVNSSGPRLELSWSLQSQSIENNTSTIKVVSYFDVTSTISYSGANGSGSTSIGGNSKSYTYTGNYSRSAKRRVLGTTYHTVTHSSSGTGSFTLNGSYNMPTLTWSGTSVNNLSASGTINLPTIYRGITDVSLSSGWSNTTNSKTITFTKLSSLATVTLQWRYWNNNANSFSESRTVSTNYTSGSSFTFSSEDIGLLHSQNPNSKTVKIEVRLTAKQGSITLPTIIKTVTLDLKLENPTVTMTYSIVGTGVNLEPFKSQKNKALQTIHNLSVTLSGSAKNSATITRFAITFQSNTKKSQTATFNIQKSGNWSIFGQVWDSRGLTSGQVKFDTLTILPYRYPKLLNYRVYRADSTGETPLGTLVKVVGNIESTSVKSSSGSETNKAWWKITLDNNLLHVSNSILSSTTLGIEQTKQFTLSFGDNFISSDTLGLSIKGTIPKGQAPLVLSEVGIGVNYIPPNDSSSNSRGVFIEGMQIRKVTGLNEEKIGGYGYKLVDYKTGNGIGIGANGSIWKIVNHSWTSRLHE